MGKPISPQNPAAFIDDLLADPPAVRARLRRLFEDCEQAFLADNWRRVRPRRAGRPQGFRTR
ncbi:DUF5937 family protein [Streptomyces inhibens]|uniref:DUF5937 family protein n=1 Tax=Streptomyces inhibens TaxID=2293571 RepID=UPI0037A93F9B